MAELGQNEVSGVFGGVSFDGQVNNEAQNVQVNAGTIRTNNLPAKVGFWQKFKAFWLQDIDWNKEIKVELTPYEQKVEDEVIDLDNNETTSSEDVEIF